MLAGASTSRNLYISASVRQSVFGDEGEPLAQSLGVPEPTRALFARGGELGREPGRYPRAVHRRGEYDALRAVKVEGGGERRDAVSVGLVERAVGAVSNTAELVRTSREVARGVAAVPGARDLQTRRSPE